MDQLTDGFAEVTLETRDLERLERFYVYGFGLDVLARETDRVWLAAGARGGRHVHSAFSAGPGGLDVLAERLRAYGAEVHGPERHVGGDRSLYVTDPEGNVVEVWDFFGRGRRIEALDEGDG